jgi:acetyl esterase/lipase
MKSLFVSIIVLLSISCAHAKSYGPYPQETYETCGSPAAANALILIHGGAWFQTDTTSSQVRKLCSFLGLRGIYVVSIYYRASNDAHWPAQLQDAQLALRWLRHNVKAKRYGVIGMSAGGQIALSMSFLTHMTYARTDPLRESYVLNGIVSHPDFVVDISGPTDLTQEGLLPVGVSALIQGLDMSTKAAEAFASPIVHATTTSSPLLIIHGIDDPVVPITQSDALFTALQDAGLSTLLTDSGSAKIPRPTGATVTYDRHAGKHVFAGAKQLPLFQEIIRFIKGTGEFATVSR